MQHPAGLRNRIDLSFNDILLVNSFVLLLKQTNASSREKGCCLAACWTVTNMWSPVVSNLAMLAAEGFAYSQSHINSCSPFCRTMRLNGNWQFFVWLCCKNFPIMRNHVQKKHVYKIILTHLLLYIEFLLKAGSPKYVLHVFTQVHIQTHIKYL